MVSDVEVLFMHLYVFIEIISIQSSTSFLTGLCGLLTVSSMKLFACFKY